MKAYFENKVAVVTGGASGIGLALCEELLALGAVAVIPADLNEAKLNEECTRLATAYPGKVLGVPTDITRQESVSDLIRQAAEFGSGRIDFLFNNAGLGLSKAFDDTTDADWKFAFDINFFGALHGIRADLTPPLYLGWAKRWVDAGATMVGGCCGISPEHIGELAKALK